MIKINLLRNKVAENQQDPNAVDRGPRNENREVIVRLFFIAIFTVLLMFYESNNIKQLSIQVGELQAKTDELDANLQAKIAEVDKYKDVEKDAKELEDKLKILRLLSRLRLREVKTLDFMQSAIPEKVWIRSLNFVSEKQNVEEGRFQFRGGAVSTEDLTDFVKRLEDSVYFAEVIVFKNQETTIPGRTTGQAREFEFSALVEEKL